MFSFARRKTKLAAMLFAFALITMSFTAKGADNPPRPMTGELSDSMCGAKHGMHTDAASCTRACIKLGGKYVLVTDKDQKVYTLKGGDPAVLNKFAGTRIKVTGTVIGNTVQISAITGAGQ